MKFILICLMSLSVFGLEDPKNELNLTNLKTKLGTQIPEGIVFTEDNGKIQSLEQIINKTTIIVPAYYGCPRLCGLVLEGVTTLINSIKLELGNEYQVVVISFNPEDTTKKALNFKNKYQGLIKKGDSTSFRFFVGEEEKITNLMKTLGFGYVKDRGEFAHSAAIFIVSPDKKISQYFTGINFSEFDVRLSLVEASKGLIGGTIEHIMMFCFRFDVTKGKYTLAAFNFMRVGAVLTLCGLIWLFISLKRKEKGR